MFLPCSHKVAHGVNVERALFASCKGLTLVTTAKLNYKGPTIGQCCIGNEDLSLGMGKALHIAFSLCQG